MGHVEQKRHGAAPRAGKRYSILDKDGEDDLGEEEEEEDLEAHGHLCPDQTCGLSFSTVGSQVPRMSSHASA